MTVSHIEFLVEEPSMEAFLQSWIRRYLPDHITFRVIVFNGKADLIEKLPSRLKGYRRWLPNNWKLVIAVDRDDDNCAILNQRLERICVSENFITRTSSSTWEVATCIAIEELEAWFFGDWQAVTAAFPRVSTTVSHQAKYRNSDQITGGTWEALERILQRNNYFKGGLQKVAAARMIGEHIVAARCSSPSFQHFASVVDQAAN